MNILVAVNSLFLKPLMVMLHSLFYNNNTSITIYLMNTTLKSEEVQQLAAFIEHYGNELVVINIPETVGNDWPLTGWYSKETYYRLLLLEYLPKTVSRILWLDADMIVNASIKKLYQIDFEDSDAVVCQSINEHPEVYLEKLGLPFDQKYFNAGMILFNLSGMRKKYSPDFLIQYLIHNVSKLQLQDQDVLNGAIGANCKFVDYRLYNMMHFSNSKFDADMLDFIFSSSSIIHYLGKLKPWNPKFHCQTYKLWIKYAKEVYGKVYYYSYYPYHYFFELLRCIKKFIKI